MNIGLIVAMTEEFQALSHLFNEETPHKKKPYKIYKNQFLNLNLTAIISNIGKVAAASATEVLINQHNCSLIINVGSSGGVNKATLKDLILSNKTGYHDVDVTAFGYKIGQIPNQPEFFTSKDNVINFNNLLKSVQEIHNNILYGTVITGDSFVNNKDKVNNIKSMYADVLAIEMEASAIAQVCHLYEKDFIFLKKISDMADQEASQSFKEEITDIGKKTSEVITTILKTISTNKK